MTASCTTDTLRRAAARKADLNGIDEVEVDAAQTTLTVTFLGHAPEWLAAENVVILGEPGQRTVRTLDISVNRAEDEGLDDVMIVRVDRPGSAGLYDLAIRQLDKRGSATGLPADFHPRYAQRAFDFKAGCPSDSDCAEVSSCPPATWDEPNIDYLARDYQGFRRLMLDRMTLTLPGWTERHSADLGVTLVEAIAYVGDQLSYYQDAVATEAYLGTARRRISVRRHARLVDYRLHEGAAARSWIAFEIAGGDITLDPADIFFTTSVPGIAGPAVRLEEYEKQARADLLHVECSTDAPMMLREARNRIAFHRWGETGCCLPTGATGATLLDPGIAGDGENAERSHALDLAPGDILILAEVLGPNTGQPEDADPAHRHAVRLIRADAARDALEGTLVWEVAWCPEDALPFPLCLDAVGDAPDCTWRDGVSIAFGNVTLASAGGTVSVELPVVPSDGVDRRCADACDAAEDAERAGAFNPSLPNRDLTFSLPTPTWTGDCRAAPARIGTGDPADALPAIRLSSDAGDWSVVGDLLSSGADDRHFVVETDDDRIAWLRFGDGVNGAAVEAGTALTAHYRTGNGIATNLAADALGLVVFRNGFPDGVAITVRNPLAFTGGAEPETVQHAKLAAPHRYRTRLERAIIPTDYSAIVERDFPAEVQRAAAVMRASGATAEIQVAIDPIGGGLPGTDLLKAIAAHLERYRRIGHDVRVVPAREVPILIALTVCVASDYRREPVAAAIRDVLGASGLFAADNWTFGDVIAASRIVATVQTVDGVAHVSLDRLERQFAGDDGEIDAGFLRLGAQEVPVFADDPRCPDRGVLTLDMRGGR